MAEILTGTLTAAVVNIAKDKLTSAIAGQANLLWNFGDDLEDMNSVLESISAALHDAERRSAKEKFGAAVAEAAQARRHRHLRHA
ncbi:hypothetical protein HU200_013573 [Digitaria exilis]|uniref:Disease resistance N-terminal domain-containing protein n=1 Tax=Digitaria exilis TaxID=1010633 RepID=A0A835KJI6_9POAL|nr:hypothetical protein HU200_013573 [Digitaria exilis]